ncbi:MAG: protein kinase [Oscillospiraceae bacterium]|nr:protein kinase [Oscillospiraceae bacterium]
MIDEYIRAYEPIDGKWKIDSLIGQGSFGSVYKLVDDTNGIKVYSALKIISIKNNQKIDGLKNSGLSNADVNNYFKAQFSDVMNEISLMYSLNDSDYIVKTHKHFVFERRDSQGWDILIHMELLTPIIEHYRTNPPSEKDVLQLAKNISSALEYCEKLQILHRDVKPDNIFYSDKGVYKLGDFGIAESLSKATSAFTKKGTHNYMAPEVYKEEGYSFNSDIYSLGILLYSLMNNNRLPFLPDAPLPITPNDRNEALARRMNGELFPAPKNASEGFAAVILKACSYDRQDRYENALELGKSLASIETAAIDLFEFEPERTVTVGAFDDDVTLPLFAWENTSYAASPKTNYASTPNTSYTAHPNTSYGSSPNTSYSVYPNTSYATSQQTSYASSPNYGYMGYAAHAPWHEEAPSKEAAPDKAIPVSFTKRIIVKMVGWICFTCLFTLTPIFIFMLFRGLFIVNYPIEGKYITELLFFGLTISVITIREMVSLTLWKKEQTIFLVALFIMLFVLILSAVFFGVMTMNEMSLLNVVVINSSLFIGSLILSISSFITGTFIQIWEEM